jgi:hypothetical protein
MVAAFVVHFVSLTAPAGLRRRYIAHGEMHETHAF